MAATFIPAKVIKHNNDVYMNTDSLTAGTIMSIPTPGAGGVIDGDFWAVPINDDVVSGFDYIPTSADSTDAPTSQSFHVFRLVSRFGNDSWYVRGTTTAAEGGSPASCGYIEAAQDAECCAASPCTLPLDIPVIAPCQVMCQWDSNSKYFAKFGLPVLTSNLRYFPYGYFNGTLLTAGSSSGYATKSTLLTFLNSGTWGAIGTWSFDAASGANSLTVTQTAGPGTDTICVAIVTLDPSA